MKGTVQTKRTKKGSKYLYISLSYTDPYTQKRRQKMIATGLSAKGNKRKAEDMIDDYIKQYQYLEAPQTNTAINNHISLCDFLDYWLVGKRLELRQSTYEGYACRIQSIKEYFQKDNPELIALTPKHFNDFFHYALKYGKVNQKTHKREPLAVRTVRSYRSILHAVYKEAIINDMVKQIRLIMSRCGERKTANTMKQCLPTNDFAFMFRPSALSGRAASVYRAIFSINCPPSAFSVRRNFLHK